MVSLHLLFMTVAMNKDAGDTREAKLSWGEDLAKEAAPNWWLHCDSVMVDFHTCSCNKVQWMILLTGHHVYASLQDDGSPAPRPFSAASQEATTSELN